MATKKREREAQEQPPKHDKNEEDVQANTEGGPKTEKHDEKEHSNPIDETSCQKLENMSADTKPENPAQDNPNAVETPPPVDGKTKPPEGDQNGGGNGGEEKENKSDAGNRNLRNDENALGQEPPAGKSPPDVEPVMDPGKPNGGAPPHDLGPMNQPGGPHVRPMTNANWPMNHPPPTGYPHLGPMNHPGSPHPGPMNNYGPMNLLGSPHPGPVNQQECFYPPVHHRPPPMVGVTYSMAQPSSIGSYYAPPPPYGYSAYPQHQMMYVPPPPPPCPINNIYDDYRDYEDDNSSQCRLM